MRSFVFRFFDLQVLCKPLYSGFQVGCHKIFHTCAINPFKIDDLNGSPEHALTFFVTTNLKTAVSMLQIRSDKIMHMCICSDMMR